jgi:hypothetical protein
MLPLAVVLVPLVPVVVEVDPETPAPAVPFRLPALVPSLLGLPLRLVCPDAEVLPEAVLFDDELLDVVLLVD